MKVNLTKVIELETPFYEILECYYLYKVEHKRVPSNPEAMNYANLKSNSDLYYAQRTLALLGYLTKPRGHYQITDSGQRLFSTEVELLSENQKTLFDIEFASVSAFVENVLDLPQKQIYQTILQLLSKPKMLKSVVEVLNNYPGKGDFQVLKKCASSDHQTFVEVKEFGNHVEYGYQPYCSECATKYGADRRDALTAFEDLSQLSDRSKRLLAKFLKESLTDGAD